MNRRLRNRRARRERQRLAKQYDELSASYEAACQKSEERLVRSLGFDPREKHGYTQTEDMSASAAAGFIAIMTLSAVAGFVLGLAF